MAALGLRPGDRCPKCGQPISSLYIKHDRRTGRRYLYAEHYDPETGKKRSCYLGPADGYEYARYAPSRANLLRLDYREAFKDALEGLLARAREMARQRGDPEPLRALESLLEGYRALVRRTIEDLGFGAEGLNGLIEEAMVLLGEVNNRNPWKAGAEKAKA